MLRLPVFSRLQLFQGVFGGVRVFRRASRSSQYGQVAQVVERSPEKAGVGGSTPSLATIFFKTLTIPTDSSRYGLQPTVTWLAD